MQQTLFDVRGKRDLASHRQRGPFRDMATEIRELKVQTEDGSCDAWTLRPSQSGALAGVVLYPDAFSVRPAMKQMAERLAGLGYVVLLPNVFYRAGEYAPFDQKTVWSTPSERGRLMALLRSITAERLAKDSAAYLDALCAQRDVRRDRIGLTGYCMGGRLAFTTAGLHPERVRAAASFHGGGLVTDKSDSPHLLARKMKAALYFGVADEDSGCTPQQQGELASALAHAHLDYQVELYSGMKHGFAVPDAGAFNADAAERHWRRTAAFFAETLR